jgi:hypothetical protein
MRQIRLTTAEQEPLEHTVKTTSDRRLRDRCQAVLMASRGRSRRATPNRLCVSMAALRATLRNHLCYFQTMRQKVLSLIECLQKAKKEAKLAAA